METSRNVGRMIGALLLVQLIGGPLVNFVLLGPALAPPGFLENAAAHSIQVSLAVVIGLLIAMASLGVAITAWPVFRRHSPAMALWFVALSAVGVATIAAEGVTLLSLVSMSQSYAAAGTTDAGLYQALGATVRSMRKWAHHLNLIVAGCMMLVFYGALLRFGLVPRVLAAFGFAGMILQLVAVTMPLFGHRIVFLLLLPMGLAHLALAGWLLVKGFKDCQAPAGAVGE